MTWIPGELALSYGLAASIPAGLVGFVLLRAIARVELFKQNAALRYAAYLGMLFCLAGVPPAFAAGAKLDARPPAAPANARVVETQRLEQLVALPSNPSPAARPARPKAAPATIERSSWAVAARKHWVLLLWAAGVLACLGRVALALLCLRHVKRSATLVAVRRTARGRVEIRTSDRFSTPVAIGYARPVILMPRAMLLAHNDNDLESVYLHELAHLQRFDDVARLIQELCLSLLWFNPFAYLLARQIGIAREMACDEAVVTRTGRPATYARALWKIASQHSDAVPRDLACAFHSDTLTVSRIANVLNSRRRRASARIRHVVTAAVVAPCALLLAAAVAPARVLPPAVLANYSAMRLPGGEVVVVGGEHADGTPVDYAQLYDKTGRRIATIGMPVPRWSAQLTPLQNGTILVTGGMTPSGATADVELLDVRARRFRRLAPLRVARAGHTATLLPGGRVLVAGGEQSAHRLVRQTEIYDVKAGRSSLTVNGSARVGQTALSIDDGNVLIVGGAGTSGRPMHCAIVYDRRLHAYRDAGTLARIGADTLTFRLPGGKTVTHRVRF